MKEIIMVALVSVCLWADGLSTKPIPPTIDGVKDIGIAEMLSLKYSNKSIDKEALNKQISVYPSPIEISKMFVKAYLDSDNETMLKIAPKEFIDMFKPMDAKVREVFKGIEKYDMDSVSIEKDGHLVQVKEPLGEKTVYLHTKNEEMNFTFGFVWVDNRWILVGH